MLKQLKEEKEAKQKQKEDEELRKEKIKALFDIFCCPFLALCLCRPLQLDYLQYRTHHHLDFLK